jgi:anti-anti-sigma factor
MGTSVVTLAGRSAMPAGEMTVGDFFGIHELGLRGGGIRLTLVGELDMAAAPTLERRLAQLQNDHTPVRIDLSRVEFIDSSGLRVLITAWNDAQHDGWRFEIDPKLSHQAAQLFELVDAKHMLLGRDGSGR